MTIEPLSLYMTTRGSEFKGVCHIHQKTPYEWLLPLAQTHATHFHILAPSITCSNKIGFLLLKPMVKYQGSTILECQAFMISHVPKGDDIYLFVKLEYIQFHKFI
ncbi:hypothetical protein O6H91_Y051700 [Diphasiastrum complanatum]|nr:hypothetical protein O6H91_Y051700 [Diphasiastrum complanatum]